MEPLSYRVLWTSSLSIEGSINFLTLNQEKRSRWSLNIVVAIVYTVYTVGYLKKEGKGTGRIKRGDWISPTAIANKPRNVIKSQIQPYTQDVSSRCTCVFLTNITKEGRPRNKYLILRRYIYIYIEDLRNEKSVKDTMRRRIHLAYRTYLLIYYCAAVCC